jgi:CheY-like chemotaxis protein
MPHAQAKPVVLIADDQSAVRLMLATALPEFGFAVLAASSGREAVERYWTCPASIDLVLLDVEMPGVDGPQTLAPLVQIDSRVRCFFMTGTLPEHADLLAGLGVLGVFAKPFRVPDVAAALGRSLYRPSSASISPSVTPTPAVAGASLSIATL